MKKKYLKANNVFSIEAGSAINNAPWIKDKTRKMLLKEKRKLEFFSFFIWSRREFFLGLVYDKYNFLL